MVVVSQWNDGISECRADPTAGVRSVKHFVGYVERRRSEGELCECSSAQLGQVHQSSNLRVPLCIETCVAGFGAVVIVDLATMDCFAGVAVFGGQ